MQNANDATPDLVEPEPEPEPDYDVADLLTWPISTESVGPLHLGMSIDDAAQILGAEIQHDERPSFAGCSLVQAGESEFWDAGLWVTAYDGVVTEMAARYRGPKDIEGVGIVEDHDELPALLGEPVAQGWVHGAGPIWVHEGQGVGVVLIASQPEQNQDLPATVTVIDLAHSSTDPATYTSRCM
ncbi:hypothetical protein [Microbacterium amylolyticum]|uniref:Uncharacterized protein n=1 Tax=Microbacterium amylolyticum TaxID=936337 RepID=A0ABS4ZJV6_9MICO|nr:hypothetical protein [Microbacterium amylolyticum]MBP2437572.1 hypothetical protein [Microbacterium amylolyticum]